MWDAPLWFVHLSSASLFFGLLVGWSFSCVLIVNAWRRERWKFMRWPPYVSLSTGVPMFIGTGHGMWYTISGVVDLPAFIARGSWTYELLPFMLGPAMLTLVYLLLSRTLLPRND